MSSKSSGREAAGLRVLQEDIVRQSFDPFAINLHFASSAGWTWFQAVLISFSAVYVIHASLNWSPMIASVSVAPLLLISLPLVFRLKYEEVILKKIATRSALLGVLFSVSLPVAIDGECRFWNFGAYFSALSFFHFTEFFIYALANPRQCTIESFMLNHSPAYNIAAVTSWIEYWLRFALAYYYGESATTNCYLSMSVTESSCAWWTIRAGLLCVLLGETLRKTAMLTAQVSFSHFVEFRKRDEHILVTKGVYRLMRHPSYSGWFAWCVGTQLVLANPLCILAYAVVAVRFFRDRVADEECYLIEFFGRSYVDYQKSTPSGVPFVFACPPTAEQCKRLQLGESSSKRD